MTNDSGYLQRVPMVERRLANGLTVIVREDHSAPVVAVVTYVRAGYFDEPDDLGGISHVLEHMYFKGTQRRGPGEIARETKAAGGYLNAGTIYDHTRYYTVLPAASLEQAIDIQADALQHSVIDEDELDRELQVIRQEARRKLDNPSAVAQERLFEAMFDAHRIRRWRIGTDEVLGRLTRADVLGFYRGLYTPSNIIVVVAGAAAADDVLALVERYYAGMEDSAAPRGTGPVEPVRTEFRYRELDGDIARTHLAWGWRSAAALHEDTPALDVLAIVLGHGRASRLYRHVRDAGAVASISAYNYTPGDIGIFGFGAELEPAETETALTLMAAVLHDARAHGFTEYEVARARNILEARQLRRLETVEGQANTVAAWQAHGDWRLGDEYLARIRSVTAGQLREVVQRYLRPDAATVLLYRPTQAESHDAARVESLVRSVAATTPAHVTVPPSFRAARALPLPHVREEDGVRFYATPAGSAQIVIRRRRTAPLVTLALYCRGGVLAERADTFGMTGLMSRASVRGTHTRSAAQLSEESESLGASIAASLDADTVSWSISVPARHFDHGVDLLLDAALEPVFEIGEAERERRIVLSELEQLRDDMHAYPVRLALSAAYAPHPYGIPIDTLEAGVRAADLNRLPAWHRDRVLRAAPHILVVGDIEDADAAAGSIAARLAGRLHDTDQVPAPRPVWTAAPGRRVETRDKAQTALALAFPGPARGDADADALLLLSAAIGGLGGRLFEELRSRRSLAYAVSAGPVTRWLGGAFVAYIGTAPEREQEARAALLDELERPTRELLDEAELERARRYILGTWQIRQQTHSSQLHELARALLLGDGLAELRSFEARIRGVTAMQVRAAAARWLMPDRMTEGIVRGA